MSEPRLSTHPIVGQIRVCGDLREARKRAISIMGWLADLDLARWRLISDFAMAITDSVWSLTYAIHAAEAGYPIADGAVTAAWESVRLADSLAADAALRLALVGIAKGSA